ncbi:MAG: HypC/HybG/HupF family hydrogenase formation chaperone [Pseudomonadota bacterium]
MCLATPAQILEISDEKRMTGIVEICGSRQSVDLSCVISGCPLSRLIGSWVMVEVGHATRQMEKGEAEATVDVLEALDEAMADIAEMDHDEAVLEPA